MQTKVANTRILVWPANKSYSVQIFCICCCNTFFSFSVLCNSRSIFRNSLWKKKTRSKICANTKCLKWQDEPNCFIIVQYLTCSYSISYCLHLFVDTFLADCELIALNRYLVQLRLHFSPNWFFLSNIRLRRKIIQISSQVMYLEEGPSRSPAL